jgi:hypothetical protein
MIKKLLFIILFFPGITSYAQEILFKIPDYKAIENEIKDKNSTFYYPQLMERLVKSDTLLTREDYRHLYFGYVFQPGYNAFWRSPNDKKMKEYYQKATLETQDYDKIIKLINQSLEGFPFDLKQLNFLSYIYHLKGEDELAEKTSKKFHNIVATILSSGDGKKCESGFHVLLVEHEYMLLNILELTSTGQSLTGKCDYLSFEKGKYKIDAIYFNIEKMLENESKALR